MLACVLTVFSDLVSNKPDNLQFTIHYMSQLSTEDLHVCSAIDVVMPKPAADAWRINKCCGGVS